MERVGEEFQTCKMVILDDLRFRVFQILGLQVADNTNFNQFPMFGQNVLRLLSVQN